jgi:DNA-binding CsgD family transcriptional regulator
MDKVRETLVNSIYDAAGNAEDWRGVLKTLAGWIGGMGGLYFLVNKQTGEFQSAHSGGHTAESELTYVGYYAHLDPHRPAVFGLPEKAWLLSQDHFDERFVQEDRFYGEYMLPRDMRWVVGTVLWQDQSTASVLAFQRPTKVEPFGKREVAGLESVSTHLRRASQLHSRLQANDFNARLDLAAVHSLSFGMAVVTDDGTVLMSNAVAERMFGNVDVFKTNGPNRIGLRGAKEHLNLLHALTAAVAGTSSAMHVTDIHGKVAAQLTTMPLPAGSHLNADWQRPLVLLLLTEPDAHKQLRPALMRQLYDITEAETRLANALMEGVSTEAYAVRHSLSENTVKSHVKSLLAKTGTNRQAELVALLARIPLTP